MSHFAERYCAIRTSYSNLALGPLEKFQPVHTIPSLDLLISNLALTYDHVLNRNCTESTGNWSRAGSAHFIGSNPSNKIHSSLNILNYTVPFFGTYTYSRYV